MRSVRTGKMRLLALLLGMMLLIAPAIASFTYTVQAGDTLAEIAQRHAVSLNDLVAENAIKNSNRISVGQVLTLPDHAVMPEADAKNDDDAKAQAEQPHQLRGRELLEYRARVLAEQRQQQGEQVVSVAQSFTGTPYQWGGLSARGIDCSGLVVRAMRALGKDVPHHAATLFKMGIKVTYGELQPGDLVFFNTLGKGVSHVGIWVGDHHFIHASSSGGVKVSKMEGFYTRTLVGARRLL